MKPVVLIILDGWGYDPEKRGNAIAMASTPNLDILENDFPSGLLQASGISAGLPWLESGNSEVGHMSVGAGKIFYQTLTRISQAISDGSFFENSAFKGAVKHTQKFSSSLHLMGLLGTGSVHSYIEHLEALLDFVQREKVTNVFLHLFLDGRDTPAKEGVQLIKKLEEKLQEKQNIKISTVIGRHYAMDRDSHWDRIRKAYQLIVGGQGEHSKNIIQSIRAQYKKGISDELIEPIIVEQEEGAQSGLIKENDAVIFFNFREDRARQLTYSFVALGRVSGFIPTKLNNLFFVTMTRYEDGLDAHVAFPVAYIENTLSELISRAGKKQFKIAETEKYAHITYFFDGGQEKENKGEIRKLIPSISKENYAESPELRTREIGKELIEVIKKNEYSFLLANLANADILGHTGDINLTIRGIEVVDKIVGDIVKEVLNLDGVVFITADHGNAERMINLKTGEILTSHTSNPVPYWIIANNLKKALDSSSSIPSPRRNPGQVGVNKNNKKGEIDGILADVTVTILKFLDIPIPESMDGTSLI